MWRSSLGLEVRLAPLLSQSPSALPCQGPSLVPWLHPQLDKYAAVVSLFQVGRLLRSRPQRRGHFSRILLALFFFSEI